MLLNCFRLKRSATIQRARDQLYFSIFFEFFLMNFLERSVIYFLIIFFITWLSPLGFRLIYFLFLWIVFHFFYNPLLKLNLMWIISKSDWFLSDCRFLSFPKIIKILVLLILICNRLLVFCICFFGFRFMALVLKLSLSPLTFNGSNLSLRLYLPNSDQIISMLCIVLFYLFLFCFLNEFMVKEVHFICYYLI